jgi:Domain of unknown function (DUF4260)
MPRRRSGSDEDRLEEIAPDTGVARDGLSLDNPAFLGLAAIRAAHIGFDRMLGHDLKDTSGFSNTRPGRIGRAQAGA